MMKKNTYKNRYNENVRLQSSILSESSPFAYVEAYKKLKTNINYLSQKENVKKIIVTSSVPNEGKTSVAINLAASLANKETKVLLLDCDFRNPSVQRCFAGKSDIKSGLSDILAGDDSLEKVSIYKNASLNISYIPVGEIPLDPIGLIDSQRMEKLIQTLGKLFDYIICDTPPVGIVTDAALLSRYFDGVLFVIKQNGTSRQQVHAAIQNLNDVNANIIGTVMSQYDLKNDIGQNEHKYGYYAYEYGRKN